MPTIADAVVVVGPDVAVVVVVVVAAGTGIPEAPCAFLLKSWILVLAMAFTGMTGTATAVFMGDVDTTPAGESNCACDFAAALDKDGSSKATCLIRLEVWHSKVGDWKSGNQHEGCD